MKFKVVIFGWVIRDAKTLRERLNKRPIYDRNLHNYVLGVYQNREFGIVIYEMITDSKPRLKRKHKLD